MFRMHLDLGIKLALEGNLENAVVAFCKSIELNPNYSPAYNNLGLVLSEMKKLYEAEACFRRAIELSPNDPHAYNNLGLVLIDLNFLQKAVECFQRAIELFPDQPEIYNNLGTAWEEQSCIVEAKEAYCQAIQLNPNYPEAYYNMGGLMRRTKCIDEAETYFCRAIELKPDYSEAKLALALLHFLRGKFEQGWATYEKTRLRRCTDKQLKIPNWLGEDLTGRSILLYWEYGFGDTIQFVRYVNNVAKSACNIRISLWVQAPLERLLRSAHPNVNIVAGDCPPVGQYDFACSLLSLPVRLNTSSETIPDSVPYKIDHSKEDKNWCEILGNMDQGKRYRVGVVWAGHPKHLDDRKRSIPFAVFDQLFSVSNVSWVSLQVGVRAEDLTATSHTVINVSKQLIDFMETAKLIEALDIVITVDSAVAHLAATMGKTTWVLLSFDADWRWQLAREDSPWYPAVRLFRQRKLDDWQEVIERVMVALQEQIDR